MVGVNLLYDHLDTIDASNCRCIDIIFWY